MTKKKLTLIHKVFRWPLPNCLVHSLDS